MVQGGLADRVINFTRFLRNRGYKSLPSSSAGALQGLAEIDITDRRDFFITLRAALTASEHEWRLFPVLFEEFWAGLEPGAEDGPEDNQVEDESDGPGRPELRTSQDPALEADTDCPAGALAGPGYSPVSVLSKKDLACIDRQDIRLAQLIMKNIMSSLNAAATRRFIRAKTPGRVDLRRVLKRSVRSGGLPLELVYKKSRKKPKRLVVLTDVSGSMDCYAQFVLPFILGLNRLGPRVEVMAFSTELTRITPAVKRLTVDKALEVMAREVPHWSGGTRIGRALAQFDSKYGERLLNRRTVVVIFSDGWDRGDREQLKEAMAALSRRAYCVFWVNPLAGDPDYQPVCRGMAAALPYVDYFLPAHSLAGLKLLGKTLTKVMAR